MSRYIDADEFVRCLRNYRPYVDSGRFNAIQTEVNQVLDCIEYEIEDAPSIDICFCRECKYARNIEGEWICEHLSGMVGLNVVVKADDFCSYGVKRSEKPNNSERRGE